MQVGIAAQITSPQDAAFVRDAERVGAGSVWVPETWGQDVLTQLAYLAARTDRIALGSAIAQLGTRTPTMLAMSAMSMQMLSGGRFRLGIGTSGPQVMEGWHGVSFSAPLAATRETISIVRAVARGERLTHHGDVYQLPRPGGAGRALRSALQPVAVPVYVASLGPRNLALTGELADGWIGNTFMPEHAEAFLGPLRAGAAAAGRSLADLDLVIPVAVEMTDRVEEATRQHARGYAFTIGAMGSKDQNFYNAALTRQGFGDDVRAVQELWLAGRRDEAAGRVPLEFGSKTNLIGTPGMIIDRLRLYRDAGITTLQAKLAGERSARLDTLAQLVELVAAVNREAGSQEPSSQHRGSHDQGGSGQLNSR
jgi:F420-dependent oxidoreductase-like protein